jgi:hypothetical protein
MLIRILALNLFFLNTLLAQQKTVDWYCSKYKTKGIEIKEVSFELLRNQEDINDSDKVQFLYKCADDSILFLRNWSKGNDTAIFLNKKFILKTDGLYDPIDKEEGEVEADEDGAFISLDNHRTIYQIKYKQKSYLVFDTRSMGATGKGAAFSIPLIFSKNKNGKMLSVLANEFQTSHFVDYGNDGTLDLIYQNWQDKIVCVNLETGKISTLK